MHIEIPNDDNYDSNGGGEEPLIQEPDLDSLVSQVSPQFLEKTPEHHLIPTESASATEHDTTPPESTPPTEPDTSPEEALHTVNSFSRIVHALTYTLNHRKTLTQNWRHFWRKSVDVSGMVGNLAPHPSPGSSMSCPGCSVQSSAGQSWTLSFSAR